MTRIEKIQDALVKKDLDAVVPLMPRGDALPPEDRKALVEFLKAL